jgi:hypothetical protein
MYHSTVMQRPEEEEESARRERMINAGASSSSSNTRPYNASSPTQTDLNSTPYSPTNGTHSRPHFNNNTYHPVPPAALPMPTSSPHISGPPASPRTVTAPSTHQSEYQPASREKPTSNYYDPTSDSSERRPSESATWSEGQNSTPQVRGHSIRRGMARFVNSFLTLFSRLENLTSTHQLLSNHLNITTAHTLRQWPRLSPLDHPSRMATRKAR